MTNEEKKLVETLLSKAENIEQSSVEQDDKSFIEELERGMSTASFVFDIAKSQKAPRWLKRWLKKLWFNVKIAIANTLRELACTIDPTCTP